MSSSPEILSMEFSRRAKSHYRIRFGDLVKYVVVLPGTFDFDELLMPLASLPQLPYGSDSWNVAEISRITTGGEVKFSLANHPLAGVLQVWHPKSIDCLQIERVRLLTANTSECRLIDKTESKFIVKIARFEWEIPRVERETRAYRMLQGTGITPLFLGHVHEQGRVIGFVLEKEVGHSASIEHLSRCQNLLSRCHQLGLLHGDVNRHNFIVQEDGIKLIDFEHSEASLDKERLALELASLPVELQDESGRGAGFMTDDEDELEEEEEEEVEN